MTDRGRRGPRGPAHQPARRTSPDASRALARESAGVTRASPNPDWVAGDPARGPRRCSAVPRALLRGPWCCSAVPGAAPRSLVLLRGPGATPRSPGAAPRSPALPPGPRGAAPRSPGRCPASTRHRTIPLASGPTALRESAGPAPGSSCRRPQPRSATDSRSTMPTCRRAAARRPPDSRPASPSTFRRPTFQQAAGGPAEQAGTPRISPLPHRIGEEAPRPSSTRSPAPPAAGDYVGRQPYRSATEAPVHVP
jgi:hypothetical protein